MSTTGVPGVETMHHYAERLMDRQRSAEILHEEAAYRRGYCQAVAAMLADFESGMTMPDAYELELKLAEWRAGRDFPTDAPRWTPTH